MPGIHVRTIKKVDWPEQEASSVITVPGSYWLCYKKHIYKFIFKYHPLHRSTERFTYEKELINVIRRIIKSNPCQGQHFMTRNLLITCNHTSWTRKDKLYAVLKFKNRPDALTFSHAFLLTVTLTTPPGKSSLTTLRSVNNEAKESGTNAARFPIQTEKHTDSPEETSLPSSVCEETTLGIASIDTNLTEIVSGISPSNSDNLDGCLETAEIAESPKNCNPRFSTQIHDTSQARYTTRSRKEHSVIENEEELLSIDNKICEENTEHDKLQSSSISEEQTCSDHVPTVSFSHSNSIGESETSLDMAKQIFPVSNVATNSRSDKSSDCNENQDVQNLDNTLQDSTPINEELVTDSLNLPYQYFIEKDIQETKPDILIDKVPTCDDIQWTSRTETSSENETGNEVLHSSKVEKEKSSNDAEVKNVSNGMKSRSSDITDLVMEGLMFTIREDKDSVAVIEAKTKFEVDEVLENSEKAETKEGEKCLKNSSLLGLENLITMIEEPSQRNKMHKNYNTIQPESTSSHFASFTDDTLYKSSNDKLLYESFNWENRENKSPEPSTSFAQTSINFSSPCSHFGIMRQNESRMISGNYTNIKMECSEDEEEDEHQDDIGDEEEDIIPEALLKNGTAKGECNTEYSQSTRRSHLPRIVSNEIITTDQIPLAIQIVLKNKLSKQNIQRVTKDRSKELKIESQSEEFSVNSNESRLTEAIHENLENQPELELTMESSVNNKIIVANKKDKSSFKSHKEKSGTDKTGTRTSTRRKELELHRVSIKELKRLAPKGLQDITQDFYRDVLQMQKRSSVMEHRSLRQRKRSTDKDSEIRVEMLKFVRDITMGAKVVIKRLSTETISNILKKNTPVHV